MLLRALWGITKAAGKVVGTVGSVIVKDITTDCKTIAKEDGPKIKSYVENLNKKVEAAADRINKTS